LRGIAPFGAGARSALSDRDFMAIAKALFTSKGFEIRDRHRPRIDGKQIQKRNKNSFLFFSVTIRFCLASLGLIGLKVKIMATMN